MQKRISKWCHGAVVDTAVCKYTCTYISQVWFHRSQSFFSFFPINVTRNDWRKNWQKTGRNRVKQWLKIKTALIQSAYFLFRSVCTISGLFLLGKMKSEINTFCTISANPHCREFWVFQIHDPCSMKSNKFSPISIAQIILYEKIVKLFWPANTVFYSVRVQYAYGNF